MAVATRPPATAEATAAIGTPDVRLIAHIEPSGSTASFAFDPQGVEGAVYQMLNHGL